MYLNISKNQSVEPPAMVLFRDRVQDRLSAVDGVAEVRAFGYHEPMMQLISMLKKIKTISTNGSRCS